MKKFWIQIVALMLLGFGAMYLSFNSNALDSFFPQLQPPAPKQAQKLTIGTTVISVEVADTPALRNKGLSNRDKLDPMSGMLFVFPETKKYQFWMKDMNFSLDFLWIKDSVVVDILKNVPAPVAGMSDEQLPRYEPITDINKVLEVNAGFVDTHGIKVGDTITLESK